MPTTTIADAVPATPVRWPVPEERRTVSVLFVDIVGSTALVDRLDPEDVRALQRAYFATVAEVLRRWHGVVEKYIGDAVMALFGARDSDGFDAYRAVRAGLEIQRALDRRSLVGGPALRVRVGVATGEAVVELAGARDGGHGAASGAVITAAARLQEYAPPGGVALCAATHRATAGLVEQRRVPPVAMAGKESPVEVWHATAVVRPAPVRHGGPFLGRRRELAAARDQIVRAVRDRRPRWVSVVGPAGSGRSRLLHELSRAVATVDSAPVRWCVAHCPPYPDHPLAPVAELVRGFAGLRATDSPARVRRRLGTALAGLQPPGRLRGAVSTLALLLSRPDDAGGPDAAALWEEALLALAARQPVVVAVDDVDRAAPEVTRFLRTLLAAATDRGLPLAVVTAHRPHWTDPLPGSDGPVDLRPLDPVESGRLLRHLLTRAGRPVALVDRLLPLVGGSPGHAVAYVRSLVEGADNAAELPVPEPVRRAVDARLDRLDGDQRAALMAVASRPPACTAPIVDRLLAWAPGRARPALRALVALGLLATRPVGGYAVAEAVVRQVAYARLPRAVRAEFARRAAAPATAPTAAPTAHAALTGTTDATPARRPVGTAVGGSTRAPEPMGAQRIPPARSPRGPAATPVRTGIPAAVPATPARTGTLTAARPAGPVGPVPVAAGDGRVPEPRRHLTSVGTDGTDRAGGRPAGTTRPAGATAGGRHRHGLPPATRSARPSVPPPGSARRPAPPGRAAVDREEPWSRSARHGNRGSGGGGAVPAARPGAGGRAPARLVRAPTSAAA